MAITFCICRKEEEIVCVEERSSPTMQTLRSSRRQHPYSSSGASPKTGIMAWLQDSRIKKKRESQGRSESGHFGRDTVCQDTNTETELEARSGLARRPRLQRSDSNVAGGEADDDPPRLNMHCGERLVDVEQVLQLKSIVDNMCKEYDEKQIQYVLEAVIPGDKTCQVCKMVLHNTYTLRAHIRSKHMMSTEFACKKCNKNFGNKGRMNMHMRKHQGDAQKFLCSYCEKPFTTVGHRNEHEKLHFTNIPCKYNCGKIFHHKKNKTYHETTCPQQPGGKAAIEKISCLYCARSYAHKRDVNTHIKKKHPGRKFLE